jgi:gluconolactonase
VSTAVIEFLQLAEGLDHPEGLAWDPRTGVVYAGGEDGQVYRVTLDGDVTQVATTGGSLLGLVVDGQGRVYCCDADRGEVVRVDPGSGAVEAYSRMPMVCPNAACFDDDGNLYVTQSGDTKADNGSIVRVLPGGETSVWSTDLPRYPNGICLAADGRSLYVVESYLPGVSLVPIEPDGSAGRPTPICELPLSVPDGVALDVDGTLYVSCYRPDRIYRIHVGETPEVLADDWQGVVLNAPTNVAFVGDELDRLAVANVGEVTLVIGDVAARGLPLRYPAVP